MDIITSQRQVSRRGFVGIMSAAGLSIAASVALDFPENPPRTIPPRQDVASEHEPVAAAPRVEPAPDATTAVPATNVHAAHDADEAVAEEMDRLHEVGIKSFPAPTEGLGGQPLAYERDGDVKVFELTSSVIDWEVEPGKVVEAWAFNNMVPGPEIRVTEGDKVRIKVTNRLPESTGVHWHGLVVPNAMDGVPFLTQPPITPDETFVYEFTVKPAGTHMYHSHHNAAKQVSMGLLGAFIVEPEDPETRPAFDREFTIVLNDGPHGFTINGKGFPATMPLVCKQGEKVLIRYMNEGMMIHPMHLHGMPQLVVAKDGYLQPQAWMCDTLNVAPGERWEVIVDATELGAWAFHCHILTHAESTHGMVTVFIVEE